MIGNAIINLAFLVIVALMLVSCGDDASEFRKSPDWSAETHEAGGEPDYDIVFGDADGIEEDDEALCVKRIDISISRKDWNVMFKDMQKRYGFFGKNRDNEGLTNPLTIDDMLACLIAENPVWGSCTLRFNNLSWTRVGIRFKGQSPMKDIWGKGVYKLPFELDFDKFEENYPLIENQRFYGFDTIYLSNNYLDDSLIREKIAADIFRQAGIPSPRTSFCRLYIDYGEGEKYFGLYTMVEGIEEPFINSCFSGPGGNLYQPVSDFAGVYSDSQFTKKNNEEDGDFSDVRAFYDAINLSRGFSDLWEKNLESVFDVDGFIHWLAVNTVIQNWATYGIITYNYYLYNDPEDGLLHWIPVGNNTALTPVGVKAAVPLNFNGVGSDWPLIRYTMDDPKYRSKYIDYIDSFTDNYFYETRMKAIYLNAHNLIQPYVTGEYGETEGYTLLEKAEDFNNSLDSLNSYVLGRYEKTKELVFFERVK